MFRSLHVAATGMAAQETMLDTISNNLANSNTTGYKKQTAQFQDLMYQDLRGAQVSSTGTISPASAEVGAGSRVVATARQFSQGSMQQTGNTYDLAIEGQGFFQVLRPNGDYVYTRDGTFQLDYQGRLVTNEGLYVEPGITVPLNATSITVAPDGTVSCTEPNSTQQTTLGQLNIATFYNNAGLQSLGHNFFMPTTSSGDAQLGTPGINGIGNIMQGALETSNVDVVSEMVGLIKAQRSYEINSKVVSAADEMLRNATQMQ